MAKEPYTGVVALCLLLITIWLSITWDEHASFERPAHSAVVGLFIAGITLVVLSRTNIPIRVGQGDENPKRNDDGYSSLPTEEIELSASRPSSSRSQHARPLQQAGPQKRRLTVLALVVGITIRAGTLRKVADAAQCTVNDLEKISLPLIFAVYDYLTNPYAKTKDDERDAISNTVFEDFFDAIRWSRIRYLPLAILFTIGVYLTSPQLPSTFMCAEALEQRNYVIALQVLGLFLDTVIIISAWHLLKSVQDDRRRLGLLGYVAICSVIPISSACIIYLIFHPSSIAEAFTTSSSYKYSIFIDGLALAAVLFCLNYVSRRLRPFAIVIIITFASTFITLVWNAREDRRVFPPQADAARRIGLFCLYFGFVAFMFIYKSAEAFKNPKHILRQIHILWYILLMAAFVYAETIYFWRNNEVGFHPIKLMMYQAQSDSAHWTKQASVSDSLQVAVSEYTSRYHRLPPPNFDKWFAFAQERNCLVIDSYDQIYDDLLPFWGMDPSFIRQNSIARNSAFTTIMINRGHDNAVNVEAISADFNDPITDMIRTFAQWLPPMQIIFNPGPEPQVAISYSTFSKLQRLAQKSAQSFPETVVNSFTPSSGWGDPVPPSDQLPFTPSPLHLSRWDAYLLQSCPFSSPARRHPYTARTLCTRCSAPHSVGQFLHNISLALNPCLQPDLHTLSSFLASSATSPLTGYPSSQLIPIFSGRKIQGYNDILFPIPESYVSRHATELPNQKTFSELEDKLFWRGDAPSSGLPTHSWQGIAEQRLVSLAHQGPPGEKIPFLLPLDKDGNKFSYEYVRLEPISAQLQVDAGFSGIPSANFPDSEESSAQNVQFAVSANLDDPDRERFDKRYLLSMDSNPPGQFVQDLRSNSVAMRGGIFREWWEERLTPWLHYIPLDMRWQGLHSTLAYFGGLAGTVKGVEVEMKSGFEEGRWVADEGRKRVESVMREADAEVYLFRLLLEWGRVVDDKREELGFRL